MSKYETSKRREAFTRWIVWRLPAKLVYWSVIRATAHATTGPYGSEEAPGMAWDTILERWEQDKMKKKATP